MGCLSSRSTIAPSNDLVESRNQRYQGSDNKSGGNHLAANGTSSNTNDKSAVAAQQNGIMANSEGPKQQLMGAFSEQQNGGGASNSPSSPFDAGNENDISGKKSSMNGSADDDVEAPDNDIMSVLMDAQNKSSAARSNNNGSEGLDDEEEETTTTKKSDSDKIERESESRQRSGSRKANEGSSSFDDEPNMELLRQYLAVDYEITQLEDKDTLRVYHEKIEQLEQLERELDMISTEVEEVAARSEATDFGASSANGKRMRSPAGGTAGDPNEQEASGLINNNNEIGNDMDRMLKDGAESNSLLSGATGSMSRKSWAPTKNNNDNKRTASSKQNSINDNNARGNELSAAQSATGASSASAIGKRSNRDPGSALNKAASVTSNANGGAGPAANGNGQVNVGGGAPYSTVEEVFNRKIILEKERDKLKKEVEMVIIECDKLQQRYKRRDEILDKLFDGRAGNGLENHLEQQLNWLLEQKHYVDQVFYAWKRAETLTSQTSEQFASALELLKRLPKIQDAVERDELAKSIGQLLIKSRQDMEQAQKYNPNVDAPFFTDNETERFDKIIETISSNSINPTEYSQILTVIQFAYKRTVSIRLWLEQILQTTIARDSFELAEEYKWIAIQLRKERINLIKLKLREQPYRSMAQSVLEEMAKQQQQQQHHQNNHHHQGQTNKQSSLLAADDGKRQSSGKQNDIINRDSGVESETNEMDIEEEIYRLLELNKARLEGSLINGSSGNGTNKTAEQQQHDQMMRDRIERRVNQDGKPMAGCDIASHKSDTSTLNSISTPTKLRIELDEEARQRLLSKY